jgi:hypothetical protein
VKFIIEIREICFNNVFFKNRPLKPLGPGALSAFIYLKILSISSIEKGSTNESIPSTAER